MMSKTDNELIAEFMGAELWRRPDFFVPAQFNESWVFVGNPGINGDKETKHHYTEPQMLYKSSWDWLMPVVEKISHLEAEYDVDFGYGTMVNLGMRSRYTRCSITNWISEEIAGVGGKPTLIQTVYETVVYFIKWYNNSVAPEDLRTKQEN